MIPLAEIIQRHEADYRTRYGHQLTPERGRAQGNRMNLIQDRVVQRGRYRR